MRRQNSRTPSRAGIMKQVQKVTMTPDLLGKTYIASGNWDLLGNVAVTMVPGAGIECNRLSQGQFSHRVGRMSIRTANLVFPRRFGRGGGDRNRIEVKRTSHHCRVRVLLGSPLTPTGRVEKLDNLRA